MQWIWKLSRKSNQLPSSLEVKDGLRKTEKYPVGGGGFADVWKGELKGQGEVAIKALRIFSKDPTSLYEARKVCTSRCP